MRDYEKDIEKRIGFIRNTLKSAGAKGVVFGNSGGKDSSLVGILCKKACENTIGVIMPCTSKRNYESDKIDAETVAKKYGIETRFADLSKTKNELVAAIAGNESNLNYQSLVNIAPRLRMATLYAIAANENLLVAGTGNRSETYMGYFTKWGDGACDFNPIQDLTVVEVYGFLRFFDAPACIMEKAPSAGLFDGQTDEKDMGVTYKSIDDFILSGKAPEKDREIIERYHRISGHKRRMPPSFYGK